MAAREDSAGRPPLVALLEDALLGDTPRLVACAAPMVRYSKLPYRMLLRNWGCDVVYTPMITADTFCNSLRARNAEFTTCRADRPLVVQFGAANASDFARAAELVAHCADGVDLNCGCPQRWAIKDGIGCALLRDAELVRNMVREAQERSGLPISVKIRVDADLRKTVDYVQAVEKSRPAWITVHGRTKDMKSSHPPDWDAIKLVRDSVSVPVVANGNVFSLKEAQDLQNYTGCHGVMAARGLLENPALFQGHTHTPPECVKEYVKLALEAGTTFPTFQHSIMMMTWQLLTRLGILEFLTDRGLI